MNNHNNMGNNQNSFFFAPQAVAVGVVAANNNLGFVAFVKNQAPGLR